MAKLEVGQKLVLDFIGGEVEGVITKVGRKWANVATPSVRHAREDMRIDMEDLRVYVPNRENSICRAFLTAGDRNRILSEERARIEAEDAWLDFKRALGYRYGLPSGLSASAIRQAAALLGLELPKRASAGAPDSKGGDHG
ncbi:hypothetical protein D9623_33480 (plasmid) [Azospirillum brasilense]|uniref:Uncharacterized protein n=2 Tax=root TaxID=1 RepID=A0A4D8QQW1_AZOBR|nr:MULTISPECIES: hypothetical protein [Azospirillum]MDW7555349.1 hypothetical protein [Azospirillum brasilense]MDW7595243.1 hypothetical protein [Azospirillum brasilense]MDW7630397.1 hypothetical protein [Azospirillum brasilense]MDX5949764.1 hypothetical protein [Azospirillum brasilense]QCO12817.1 hypothetical protein D3868_27810 [Azospirillum brasilense]